MIRTIAASKNRIKAVLRDALGQICWHVSVGGCTLPSFSMALGEKIKRKRRLRNATQPEEYRDFFGNISFLVWCTWRLQSGTVVIASSDMDEDEIKRGLNRIVGKALLEVTIEESAWDLTIDFSDGLRLKVFCDHAGKRPSFDGNWEARVGSKRVIVGPGTKLQIR